jgi:pimeloyl-ACP methyl ester carboxylesterase
VRGDKSAFIEAEDVAQFAALACPVYTIADAGHFLHIEQPESTLALLEHVV